MSRTCSEINTTPFIDYIAVQCYGLNMIDRTQSQWYVVRGTMTCRLHVRGVPDTIKEVWRMFRNWLAAHSHAALTHGVQVILHGVPELWSWLV